MKFTSTGGRVPPAPLEEALHRGLAPDGGLYMPEALPVLPPSVLKDLPGRDWPNLASAVTRALFGTALDHDLLESITAEALNFPLPMVQLKERLFVLELFRGPTLAFKDVGARFMARLLAHFRKPADPLITILTATSGDTGGAVAHAFHGLSGTRVVILFPDGRVTPRQERQFSTLGGNVTAVAVQGDFDDCQRLAKEAFREETRSEGRRSSKADPSTVGAGVPVLTSANSINVGRFLPQTTYFLEAWARLQELHKNRTSILFTVPSGNFGNLAAGLLAKAMGMTGVSYLAATNENDVVPEFLRTGRLTRRPSIPTLSTAMDVGSPSNLDRILHLYPGGPGTLRKDLVGRKITDAQTRACIRRVHRETGYILDPHSAVGFAALEEEMKTRPEVTGVLLATAHPAKFAEVVEPIVEEELPIPLELSRCMGAERAVVHLEPRLEALKELLQDL